MAEPKAEAAGGTDLQVITVKPVLDVKIPKIQGRLNGTWIGISLSEWITCLESSFKSDNVLKDTDKCARARDSVDYEKGSARVIFMNCKFTDYEHLKSTLIKSLGLDFTNVFDCWNNVWDLVWDPEADDFARFCYTVLERVNKAEAHIKYIPLSSFCDLGRMTIIKAIKSDVAQRKAIKALEDQGLCSTSGDFQKFILDVLVAVSKSDLAMRNLCANVENKTVRGRVAAIQDEKSQNFNKSIECFNCRRIGHISVNCNWCKICKRGGHNTRACRLYDPKKYQNRSGRSKSIPPKNKNDKHSAEENGHKNSSQKVAFAKAEKKVNDPKPPEYSSESD